MELSESQRLLWLAYAPMESVKGALSGGSSSRRHVPSPLPLFASKYERRAPLRHDPKTPKSRHGLFRMAGLSRQGRPCYQPSEVSEIYLGLREPVS